MRYVLIAVGIAVVLVIGILLVGWTLPVNHRATRQVTLAMPAAALLQTLTDVGGYPAWRTGIKRVDILSTNGSTRRYREVSGDGSIEYTMDLSQQPHKLVTTIVGGVRAFGGSWTFDLTPAGDSTTLQITEDGKVFNPVFRFMARFVIGYYATIDRYMADLGKRTAAGVVRGAVTLSAAKSRSVPQ